MGCQMTFEGEFVHNEVNNLNRLIHDIIFYINFPYINKSNH